MSEQDKEEFDELLKPYRHQYISQADAEQLSPYLDKLTEIAQRIGAQKYPNYAYDSSTFDEWDSLHSFEFHAAIIKSVVKGTISIYGENEKIPKTPYSPNVVSALIEEGLLKEDATFHYEADGISSVSDLDDLRLDNIIKRVGKLLSSFSQKDLNEVADFVHAHIAMEDPHQPHKQDVETQFIEFAAFLQQRSEGNSA